MLLERRVRCEHLLQSHTCKKKFWEKIIIIKSIMCDPRYLLTGQSSLAAAAPSDTRLRREPQQTPRKRKRYS